MAIPKRSAEKAEFWRMVLDEQQQSGLTAKAFCQQQGVSVPSFYAWRRRLQKMDEPTGGNGRLVPVTVVEALPPKQSTEMSSPRKAIQLMTPSGFCLQIDPAVSASEVTALLEAIEASRSGDRTC